MERPSMCDPALMNCPYRWAQRSTELSLVTALFGLTPELDVYYQSSPSAGEVGGGGTPTDVALYRPCALSWSETRPAITHPQ